MVGLMPHKDVIVAGGGVAGIAAAVAAARNGAKVILVERYGVLGGTATAGLMAILMGFNRKIIKGIATEFVDKMTELGGAIEGVYTPFDTEVFKQVAFDIVEEAGVELLLHSWTEDVMTQDNLVKGVVTFSKSGHQMIPAEIVVDTTGDADVAASARVEFERGQKNEGTIQPVTLIFKMANVDVERLLEYIENNPDQFAKGKFQTVVEVNRDAPFFIAPGFFDLIKEAKQKGDLQVNHNLIGVSNTPRPKQITVNATRSLKVDGTNVLDITRGEIETRKQMVSVINFLRKYVPGFKSSYLVESGYSLGIRETRRIVGEYMLSEKDIMEGRVFNDAIAQNFFPMDVHGPISDPEGHFWGDAAETYQIPYRCLIPQKVDNLLIAGRCISATHNAQGSVRSMPCCMATGQAAGTAAALCTENKLRPRQLETKILRRKLKEQGVIL